MIPRGSFLFQTALGGGAGPGGIYAYTVNRSTGSLSHANASPYLTNLAFYADVVDNQGKFLFAQALTGIYAFSIQAGGMLTPVAGSPFPSAGPTLVSSAPANRMAVDQTNKFLYVSTSAGIEGYTIDSSTGQLTAITGSPFGANVNNAWAIVITPNNAYLYETQSPNTAGITGYSIDQTSGALTPLSGSPFSAGSCGSVVPPGTIGAGGPADNMTIARAGKFMYDNCGIYSIDQTSGALTVVSNQGPGVGRSLTRPEIFCGQLQRTRRPALAVTWEWPHIRLTPIRVCLRQCRIRFSCSRILKWAMWTAWPLQTSRDFGYLSRSSLERNAGLH